MYNMHSKQFKFYTNYSWKNTLWYDGIVLDVRTIGWLIPSESAYQYSISILRTNIKMIF